MDTVTTFWLCAPVLGATISRATDKRATKPASRFEILWLMGAPHNHITPPGFTTATAYYTRLVRRVLEL